jgi:hypothetical protein
LRIADDGEVQWASRVGSQLDNHEDQERRGDLESGDDEGKQDQTKPGRSMPRLDEGEKSANGLLQTPPQSLVHGDGLFRAIR